MFLKYIDTEIKFLLFIYYCYIYTGIKIGIMSFSNGLLIIHMYTNKTAKYLKT